MKIVIQRREKIDVPDGINIHIFTLANYLNKLGHEVIILTSFGFSLEKVKKYFHLEGNIVVESLSEKFSLGKGHLLILWIFKGNWKLKKIQPDYVIVNGAVPVFRYCTRVFVSHDLERRGRFEHLNWLRITYKRFAYKFSDIIVATTTELKSALADELKIQHSKVNVIPTCYKLDKYKYREFNQRVNAILHIGTVFYKNPLITLDAIQNLEGLEKLYITGEVTQQIKDYIRKLPQEASMKIEFKSYLNEKEFLKLLSSVKIVSVPSNYELPVASPTVVEAFASGTPVVTTNSISEDVVSEEFDAIVIKEMEVDGFYEAFKILLENQSEWERRSLNSQHKADKFNVVQIASAYLRLIK